MQCIRCSLDRASRSPRRGAWEHFASLFGFYPYRCRDCGHRYLTNRRSPRLRPSGAPGHTAGRRARATHRIADRQRRWRELLLYGLGLLLVVIFLYVISRDRGG